MGIPIELPGWTQVVAWIFLVLLAAAIGAVIYNTLVRSKDRILLEEVHAKSDLIMMILRSQAEQHEYTFSDYLRDNPPADVEATTPHGRLVQ